MASVANTIYGMTGYFKPVPFTKGSPYFIANIGNGIQLANKIYDYNPFSSNGEAINKTFDGGFIITGQYGTGPVSADIHLIRTDTYGDTLWTKTYNFSQGDAGMAVQQTADSGFIVAGFSYDPVISSHVNAFLLKTNSSNDTIWSKLFVSPSESLFYSVDQTNDHGYFLTGALAIPPNNIGKIYLIKTNDIGDTLWTRLHGNNNVFSNNGLFGKQTKDGGYIVSGIGSIGNKFGAYIIKLDSLGNVNSPGGMAELNNPFEFAVYPNPSNGVFQVTVKGLPHHKGQIEVYNINHQLLYFSPVRSQQLLTVNLTHATEGLYLVLLRTGETVFTKKFIIHKP